MSCKRALENIPMALRDIVLRNLQHYMEVRKVSNMTELARLSGVHQSVLSRFKSGIHGSINLDALEKLATTLEVDASQLLQASRYSVADTHTATVMTAMELLPDWGKEVVAASATAMVQTAKKPPPDQH
jgi:DNA-binding Xre family transcriptional regulator